MESVRRCSFGMDGFERYLLQHGRLSCGWVQSMGIEILRDTCEGQVEDQVDTVQHMETSHSGGYSGVDRGFGFGQCGEEERR